MGTRKARALEEGHAVVISSNRKPAKIQLPPHYEDQCLLTLAAKGPGFRHYDYTNETVNYLDLTNTSQKKQNLLLSPPFHTPYPPKKPNSSRSPLSQRGG